MAVSEPRERAEALPADATWQYDAFLSYSHAADRRLAPALQRSLQRLTRPWYRRPALRVFRDQASLAANPDLWGTIEAALRGSHYFVLLASPEAAKSQWVDREVAFWRDSRERETFLIALTDGTIRWDEPAGDFDWNGTDALPRRLRGWFTAEPLWVDLTWTRSAQEAQLSLQQARFRDQVATLAAAIHGRDKDQLDSEDVRQRRIATLAGRAVAATLAVLLVISGIATYDANQQRQLAQQQRAVAEQQRTVAEQQRAEADRERTLADVQALQAEAQNLRDTEPQTSLQLSLAALSIQPSAPIREGLVDTLLQTHYAGTSAAQTPDSSALVVAFSPGGSMLASDGTPAGSSPSSANTLGLWNLSNPARPALIATLTSTAQFNDVTFSPDGHTLAAATGGTVILWDVSGKPRKLATLSGLGPAQGAAFSPDGRTLAVVASALAPGTLSLWDVSNRAAPRRLASRTGLPAPTNVAFSPNGKLLLVGSGVISFSDTGTATQKSGSTLWDVSNPQAPAPLSSLPQFESGIAFSPDGRTLALGHSDSVLLWDITNPAAPRLLTTLVGDTSDVEAIAFSPDGRTLLTAGGDNNGLLWNAASPAHVTKLATLAGGPAAISAAAFTPGGQDVLMADSATRVSRWHVASAAPSVAAVLTGHTGAVQAVAISHDGHTIATASYDHSVLLWDVTDPARPVRLAQLIADTDTVSALAFSPDGKTLVTGSWDQQMILWDLSDRASPRELAVVHCPGTVDSVAFSPNGRMLVAAGAAAAQGFPNYFDPGWATLWAVSSAAHLAQLKSFAGVDPDGGGATFSPDGRVLVVPQGQLWSVASPSAVAELSADYSPPPGLDQAPDFADDAVFSPDGRILATASDNYGTGDAGTAAVVLWSFSEPATASALSILTGPRDTISDVAFHPGGNLIAASSDDQTTTLWDVADPTQPFGVSVLRNDTDAVNDVAFSADGHLLVTASTDGTATIWQLGDLPAVAADPVTVACSVTAGGLTPAQWATYNFGLPYRRSCP